MGRIPMEKNWVFALAVVIQLAVMVGGFVVLAWALGG